MMTNRAWPDGVLLRVSEAVRRGASRAQREQEMVEAAAESAGATSAAYYECQPDGALHRMAVTGLFPPQAAIAEAVLERFSTRAQLFEHVLRRPEPLSDESLAAHVAVSGRSELIADAAADARMVRHADPALTVRSIIFVPLLLREAVPGVLILANSAGGGPFSSEDFSRAESFAAGVAAVLRTAESVGLPQP